MTEPSRHPSFRRSACSALLLYLLLVAPSIVVSQPETRDPIHQATLRGIDSLYNLRFDGAAAVFDEVIRMAPNDPRGWFFKSMVSFYIYQLTQDAAAYEQFMKLSDAVIERAEAIVDKDGNNVTAKFYLGGIYGYRGLAHQRNGSLLSALWDGRKGYGYLRDAATGTQFAVDAKFGFGLFTYLVAKIPSSFSWVLSILGFSGDLEGGLNMIRTAADSGIYTRTEAAFYYAQFCFFEGRYDTAYVYMQRIMDQYPSNSLFMVTFAAWELRQDRIDQAIEVAERAIEVNLRTGISIGDEFAHNTLAAAYYARNDFPRAVRNWELYIALTENKENISNFAYYRLGIAYELLGDRQRAIRTWRSMQESTDEDRPWNSVYWRRAQLFIRRALSPADVLLVVGSNHEQHGDRLAAIEHYDRAAATPGIDNETRAVALYQRLQVTFACEDHQEVVSRAPRILQLNPRRELWTLPHTLYLLGRSYQKLGRRAEADEAFRQALRYDDYDWNVRLRVRIEQALEELEQGI